MNAARADQRLEVVACVDPRPDREAVAVAAGFSGPVYPGLADQRLADVAVLCVGSTLDGIAPLATRLTTLGHHVVSTCEELIAPQLGDPATVAALDLAARSAGRAVIGAGVNPGFAMDVLPLMLTMATGDISQIRILRRVDVACRRERLQEKVGVGITASEFADRKARGHLGHVGLRASLVFLATALGWSPSATETLEPVIDPATGNALGVRHVAHATDADGVTRVEGVLEMYAGAKDFDRIEIDGQRHSCSRSLAESPVKRRRRQPC